MGKISIALVGMPGCGKTTIGSLLAQSIGLQFIDLDAQIEKQLGMSIKTYFAEHGEAAFRTIEQQALAQLVTKPGILLSTGGGLVLNPANRACLSQDIVTVYLYARPEVIYARLKHDKKRPLLQASTDRKQLIEQLFQQRDGLYRQSARLVIDASDLNFYAIVDEIQYHINLMSQDLGGD